MNSSNQQQLSPFIGGWIALTLIAGAAIFALFYWALGGNNATPVASGPTATLPPANVVLATTAPQPTTEATQPEVAPTADPNACQPPLDFPSGFGYGIQSHVFVGEAPYDNFYWLDMIRGRMGFNWVKMQVRWHDIEPAAGDYRFDRLDNAMKAACQKGLHVMFSIVAAPTWTMANPRPEEAGEAPPDDYTLYAKFVTTLIDRYPGAIDAIEVWNEANLEREWNTAAGVSASEYVKMLALTYRAIKDKDANIIVISGAPSPTGINCNGSWPACAGGRPAVVDDATWLTQMILAGGLSYADCIGNHANGTNLPPDADAYNPPSSANYTFKGPWNSPHYSWSLRSQVEAYAKIIADRKPQCITEFGYASPVNGKYPEIYGYAQDVSEQTQGEYIVRALNWMRDSGKVKLAFIFNLDYGPKGGDPLNDDNVIFSLLNPSGAPRPALDAVAAMEKK